LCHISFRYDATVDGFLETKEDKLHDVGLSENASRCLTLLSRCLGLKGVGSAVATAIGELVPNKNLASTRARDLQKELGVATDKSLDQGISVGWFLRNRFAEGERIATGLVRSEVKVVSGDGSYDNGQG
jgi:hypothetical protein